MSHVQRKARSNDHAFLRPYSPKSGVAGAGELVAVTLVVVRVQDALSRARAGLAEEVLVKGLDLGVEVAHAER